MTVGDSLLTDDSGWQSADRWQWVTVCWQLTVGDSLLTADSRWQSVDRCQWVTVCWQLTVCMWYIDSALMSVLSDAFASPVVSSSTNACQSTSRLPDVVPAAATTRPDSCHFPDLNPPHNFQVSNTTYRCHAVASVLSLVLILLTRTSEVAVWCLFLAFIFLLSGSAVCTDVLIVTVMLQSWWWWWWWWCQLFNHLLCLLCCWMSTMHLSWEKLHCYIHCIIGHMV